MDVEITDHKQVTDCDIYVFGERPGPVIVKFCPVCGTPVPDAEGILVLEGLKNSE
jgi:hypothetical protein